MKRIYVRNTIGWHITESQLTSQINNIVNNGENDIELYINSGGGSVYDGWAMYNSIKSFVSQGVNIKVFNIGIAASMASVLMLAVPKENRFSYKNSIYMIHNASTITWGDKNEHRGNAELLDKIDGMIAKEYADNTGLAIGYVKELMNKTTWMTPDETVELGFIGSIYDEVAEEKAEIVGVDEEEYMANAPEDCYRLVAFASANKAIDLTKTKKTQIIDKAWKSYMKY